MSNQLDSLLVGGNGICNALPAPFGGDYGDIVARVGADNYCNTLRAYYQALAKFGITTSDGDGKCCGNADLFSGSWFRAVGGKFGVVGSNSGSCVLGSGESAVGGSTVSSGLVDSQSGRKDDDQSRSSCNSGKPVVADHDVLFGGNRSGDNFGSGGRDGFCTASSSGKGLGPGRGPNFERNHAKRVRRRLARSKKVDDSGGCVSDSGTSVRTVDTRTAVEIEAAQTLAARRVVENKLAIAQGKARLRGYGDRAKTDAYDRLAEARMEQRINEAKAKSQASFKKCDESLKSLGSTGSAGEFAMRREVAKARESEAVLKYVQAQADILARYATPQTLALCNDVPPPERVNLFEIFGECSSDLSPEEAENYYEQIRILEEEQDALFTTRFA